MHSPLSVLITFSESIPCAVLVMYVVFCVKTLLRNTIKDDITISDGEIDNLVKMVF